MQKRAESRASSRDRRRHKRAHVLFNGRLISGDRSAQGVLLDVPAGGARIRLSEPLEAGSAITLRLARSLDFHVEVVWRNEQTIGLRFREKPARIGESPRRGLPNQILTDPPYL